MDISIFAAQCGQVVSFDDASVALEFVRMLAHQIVPDQFVSMVAATVPDPHAVDAAKALVTTCMGAPV